MSNICVDCGLCCDGTLFEVANTLHPDFADDNGYLRLPCKHFCGKCTVYDKRPDICRTYKCKLLLKVESGEVSAEDAAADITEIKSRIAKVRAENESKPFVRIMKENEYSHDFKPAEQLEKCMIVGATETIFGHDKKFKARFIEWCEYMIRTANEMLATPHQPWIGYRRDDVIKRIQELIEDVSQDGITPVKFKQIDDAANAVCGYLNNLISVDKDHEWLDNRVDPEIGMTDSLFPISQMGSSDQISNNEETS